jgi:hypothetical protein
MKVDWQHPTFYRDFSSMEFLVFSDPGTGIGTIRGWGGGQYFATLPLTVGRVINGFASIHADWDTGEEYVKVSGNLLTPDRYTPPPPYPGDLNYWSYGHTGWPIIAALPGNRFNGIVDESSPRHEFGGREIPLVGGLDPDSDLPFLLHYGYEGAPGVTYPGGIEYRLRYNWREGPVRGGVSPASWFEEQGPEPPIPQGAIGNASWNFKAISQRCWVLILIDPSGHGFLREQASSPGDIDPNGIDGVPLVVHPGYNERFGATWEFVMIWRKGPGSGDPGEYGATQGGTVGIPSTITLK